jgi:hypothetical protein
VRDHVAHGRALLEAGEASGAAAEMKDALQIDPSSEEAAELLWRAGRRIQEKRPAAPVLDPSSEERVKALLSRAAPGGSGGDVRSALAELVLIAPDDPRVYELLRDRSARLR